MKNPFQFTPHFPFIFFIYNHSSPYLGSAKNFRACIYTSHRHLIKYIFNTIDPRKFPFTIQMLSTFGENIFLTPSSSIFTLSAVENKSNSANNSDTDFPRDKCTIFLNQSRETFPFRTIDLFVQSIRDIHYRNESNEIRESAIFVALALDEYFSEDGIGKLKIRWRGCKRRFAGFHKTGELEFSTVVFSLNKDKGMTFIVCLTPFSISTMRLSHENTGTKWDSVFLLLLYVLYIRPEILKHSCKQEVIGR